MPATSQPKNKGFGCGRRLYDFFLKNDAAEELAEKITYGRLFVRWKKTPQRASDQYTALSSNDFRPLHFIAISKGGRICQHHDLHNKPCRDRNCEYLLLLARKLYASKKAAGEKLTTWRVIAPNVCARLTQNKHGRLLELKPEAWPEFKPCSLPDRILDALGIPPEKLMTTICAAPTRRQLDKTPKDLLDADDDFM